MVPRMIKFFDSSSRGVRSVFCGSSYSMAINELGVLFMFGQNKKTGEANMYPKPVQDLAGRIRKSITKNFPSLITFYFVFIYQDGTSPVLVVPILQLSFPQTILSSLGVRLQRMVNW